jgi:hypothetical protein
MFKGDLRFALVKWKTVKPLYDVIPFTDFVKIDVSSNYETEKDYQVRFYDQTNKKMKLFHSKLVFIGN